MSPHLSAEMHCAHHLDNIKFFHHTVNDELNREGGSFPFMESSHDVNDTNLRVYVQICFVSCAVLSQIEPMILLKK